MTPDRPGHIEFVHRSWPADPAQLSAIRHELARWLTPLALTEDDRADVVLAVDEAAANVVRHAYGPDEAGAVELTLWTEDGGTEGGGTEGGGTEGGGTEGGGTEGGGTVSGGTEGDDATGPRTLCIEIVDHGSWQPPADAPAEGGRGIPLMSTMSESVLIHYDERGSRVLLRHHIPKYA